jgi:signal transduction histidine kinase
MSRPADHSAYWIVLQQNKNSENLHSFFIWGVSEQGTSEFPGSGLGLSICRMIAETHDGSIDLASRPGEGSTFTVQLPIKS